MDNISLIGAEDVRAAGNRIMEAADAMNRAAGCIDEALRMHDQRMDEWLFRFEQAVEKIPRKDLLCHPRSLTQSN
jgi:hypothetical protein